MMRGRKGRREMVADIKDIAKNLTDVFEVMGYGLSVFSFDVLSGTISIVAKQKKEEE